MKQRIAFVVPGPPVPCARPRATALMRNGKPILKNGRPVIHTFVPDSTTEYENRVALFTRQALKLAPEWQAVAASDARLRVHLHFVRTEARRSDLDNFMKGALDGLKKANEYRPDPTRLVRDKPAQIWVRGVYRDDYLITQVLASMHVDPKDEPRTEIVVETANVVLEEPLWMRVARERGWAPGPLHRLSEMTFTDEDVAKAKEVEARLMAAIDRLKAAEAAEKLEGR
jgi:Holliday junction resolvase RusA-like endonuclease